MRHTPIAERGTAGEVSHGFDMRKSHDARVVDRDIHKKFVEIDVLLCMCADKVMIMVAGNRQHRLSVELRVIQTISVGEFHPDFNDNEEQAIEARKSYWAGTFVPALFTERIYTPALSEQNGKAVGADTIRETVCISADPETHIKKAHGYIECGFDHLIFHSAGPDQRPFLEAYGRHVLPRLRKG